MIQGLLATKRKSNIQTPQIQIALTTVKRRRRVKSKETTRVQVKALKKLSTTIMTERGKRIKSRSIKSMTLRRKKTTKVHCKVSLVT